MTDIKTNIKQNKELVSQQLSYYDRTTPFSLIANVETNTNFPIDFLEFGESVYIRDAITGGYTFTKAGIYTVVFEYNFTSTSMGDLVFKVYKNGVVFGDPSNITASATTLSGSIQTTVQVEANDVLSFTYFTTSTTMRLISNGDIKAVSITFTKLS